jgi:YkoY family integral membrane protein
MVPQTFQFSDLGVVAFLVILEALLSADNALILAIMVRHLPADAQRRALLYGLGGAFIFRFVAILFASTILSLWWLQGIGTAYLLYLPIKHFVSHGQGKEVKPLGRGFWPTVIAVEIADIAFAVDSVLAGVALVRAPAKLWVVYVGAIIGVVLLRFAATLFISLLEKYPLLDHVAYVLVGWVGVKLGFMAAHNYGLNYEKSNPGKEMPWHVPEMSPYVFWGVLAAICLVGAFLAARKPVPTEERSHPPDSGT